MVVGHQLGRAIKSRRLDLGQTQDQSAEDISKRAGEGITKATFSGWERGKSAPHPRNIGALAEWMGVPVSRVAMMAEDAELPAGQRDEDIMESLRRIEANMTRLTARQLEAEEEIRTLRALVNELNLAAFRTFRRLNEAD